MCERAGGVSTSCGTGEGAGACRYIMAGGTVSWGWERCRWRIDVRAYTLRFLLGVGFSVCLWLALGGRALAQRLRKQLA
jgi:hypothetical protein